MVAQVGAARRDPGRSGEDATSDHADEGVPLGYEDVRPVQAHDQGAGRRRRGRHRASGDDPVPVHDGGVDLARHPPRGPRAGGEGQRRRQPGRPAQAHVLAESGRVAEHVQRRVRCVAEEVEGHAALARGTGDGRVPGCHEVDVVAAPRHLVRDRVHERADRIARKAGIRGRDHHHAMPASGPFAHDDGLRSTTRQGVMADSMTTVVESFDCPVRRSTKMMGTSPMRQPRRLASYSISTRNA